MIVYYVKSTDRVLSTDKGAAKEALPKETLDNDLAVMFPDLGSDVAYKIVGNTKKIQPGGKWDHETEVMTEAPPKPDPHPHKARLNELRDKWEASTTGAKPEEIAEYIVKVGLGAKI